MIISDSWLQTAYGADFGRYLLENFKVFPVPLTSTCIVLLEKPAPNEPLARKQINDIIH
jgi:hypothetical protein